MWPRCATCKHTAEAHDGPGELNERGSNCEGDRPNEMCNCPDYKLPDGWVMVDGQPVRKEEKKNV